MKDQQGLKEFQVDGPSLHFPQLSAKDLDDLAAKNIATGTKWQTKWAMKVFQGMYTKVYPNFFLYFQRNKQFSR